MFVELGTFRLIDVWKEFVQPEGAQTPYPVWRMKLHTIRPDLAPWYWATENTSDEFTASEGLETNQCAECGQDSHRVFENAPWVCLHEKCEHFFQHKGQMLPQQGNDGKSLRYSQAFMNKAEPSRGVMGDLPLYIHQMFQAPTSSIDENGAVWGTEKELRGGFTCPNCGCCNSQVYWDRKECGNCGFSQDATPRPYPMHKVMEETTADVKKFQKRHRMQDGVTIELQPSNVDKFIEVAENGSDLFIYMMKNAEGKLIGTLVLERPTDNMKQTTCGADKLLDKIQAEGGDMKFRRNPARCPGSKSFSKAIPRYLNKGRY